MLGRTYSNIFFKIIVAKYIVLFFRITAIDLSGLGSLTWLKNKIDSWIIGQLRREAMIALKSAIEKSFRETIPLMDLGDLLDD